MKKNDLKLSAKAGLVTWHDSCSTWPVLVLILLIALNFIVSDSQATHAYISASLNNQELPRWELFDEIAHTSTVDTRRTVVLYDNLHFRHGRMDEDRPVFGKGCQCLVPADIVNINLNMTYLFHGPARPAGDMLGELIYANIELKKMLEQYEKIRKTAVEIAEMAGTPSLLDSPYAIYMPAIQFDAKLDSGSVSYAPVHKKNTAKQSSSRKKPVTVTAKMKRVSSFINRSMVSSFTMPKVPATNTEEKPGEESIDTTAAPIAGIAAPEKFINMAARAKINMSGQPGILTPGSSQNYRKGFNNIDETGQKRPDKRVEPEMTGELPWWIKAPSEFITYCMNNKIEAGIMLLFFIFFLNLVGAIFRR